MLPLTCKAGVRGKRRMGKGPCLGSLPIHKVWQSWVLEDDGHIDLSHGASNMLRCCHAASLNMHCQLSKCPRAFGSIHFDAATLSSVHSHAFECAPVLLICYAAPTLQGQHKKENAQGWQPIDAPCEGQEQRNDCLQRRVGTRQARRSVSQCRPQGCHKRR